MLTLEKTFVGKIQTSQKLNTIQAQNQIQNQVSCFLHIRYDFEEKNSRVNLSIQKINQLPILVNGTGNKFSWNDMTQNNICCCGLKEPVTLTTNQILFDITGFSGSLGFLQNMPNETNKFEFCVDDCSLGDFQKFVELRQRVKD